MPRSEELLWCRRSLLCLGFLLGHPGMAEGRQSSHPERGGIVGFRIPLGISPDGVTPARIPGTLALRPIPEPLLQVGGKVLAQPAGYPFLADPPLKGGRIGRLNAVQEVVEKNLSGLDPTTSHLHQTSRDELRRDPVERPEEGSLGDPATGILGAQLVEREVAPPAEHRLSLPNRFMKRLVLQPG